MDSQIPRPSGAQAGVVLEPAVCKQNKPVETTFFTRIGTRSAVITAYYEHLMPSPVSTLPEPTGPPPPIPKQVVTDFDHLGYVVPKTNVHKRYASVLFTHC